VSRVSFKFCAFFKNGEKIGFTLTKQEGKKLSVMLGDIYKAQDGAFTVAGLNVGGASEAATRNCKSSLVKIYEFKEGGICAGFDGN